MRTTTTADALRQSVQNPDAFGAFFDAYFEDLLRYLTGRTCDADASLDLTAESFAQAYLSRRGFRGTSDGEAAAWLYRIAKRQLARYFRTGEAEQRALRQLGLERPELDPASAEEIERIAGLSNLSAALRMELDGLSPGHRETLWLRIVEELPYGEVARRLAISEPAARARVSRALKALGSALDRKQRHMMEETST